MIKRTCFLLAGFTALTPASLAAQARGMPVFFDPTYSYDKRVGIDVGHIDGGTTVVGGGSLMFYVGHCKRVALNGAAGVMLQSTPDNTGLNVGVSGSYLLNACPDVMSAPNPTFRAVAGGGLVRLAGETATDAHIGIGVGYMLMRLKDGGPEIAVGRLEFWATPRLHYREVLFDANANQWQGAVSAGLNIGISGVVGLRAGVDCCDGGVGIGAGLSLWF